jgi:hypothetical protein
MAIVDYAGFVTECLSTDGFPTRDDGWLLKYTDTGAQYIRISGAWQSLGLGLSFAPPTKSGSVTTNSSGLATIAFTAPFSDTNYSVILTCQSASGTTIPTAVVTARTASGFSLRSVRTSTGAVLGSILVYWKATRNSN